MAARPQEKPKRQRTCIGCGATSDKTALLRIVRTSDGAAQVDPKGRMAGRGAYVCSQECFEKAARTSKLQRALKMKIDDDQVISIAAQVSSAFADAQA
ncbi:hypothetical protein JI75_03795 [Berryella intestinalis]|uniref:YlxR domain-containing protein n=1 Tax=Berryella intestinalis TaxID=1531429 RepID=A0A0A8B9T3_9ACTN|nr:YlxR family protein [Berryella intestinalis]AJC11917.1 hypothetical protein JI75_03795 [Berryella intestinalis]